ncbi:hypothetical protein BDW59DRAFT_151030 [Aspergillus cavernicola]|uniref:Pleiotropic ABC efflux transporter N-terminal domain-containing protein n=1 Tax=Aspergillus cavernicola TaxID=176166 RepID=A0ABR4HXG4_9EURO
MNLSPDLGSQSDGDENLPFDHDTTKEDTLDNILETRSLQSAVEEFHGRNATTNLKERKLGVTWQNLTVEAVGSESTIQENVLSQFNIRQHIKEAQSKPSMKTILERSHGCVKPGEMLLVVGRPVAGYTTLLNMLVPTKRIVTRYPSPAIRCYIIRAHFHREFRTYSL